LWRDARTGADVSGNANQGFASPDQRFASAHPFVGSVVPIFGRKNRGSGARDEIGGAADQVSARVQEEFAALDVDVGSHPPISRFAGPNVCFGEPNV